MSHDFFFFFEPNLFLYNFDKTETWWKGVKPAVKTRSTSNLPGPFGWASLSCVLEQIESDQRSVSIRLIKKKKKAGKESKGVNPLEEKGEAASKRGQSKVHTCNIDWVERRLWKEETRGCSTHTHIRVLVPYTEKYCCKLENMPKFRYCHLHHCLPTSFLSFIFRIKSWTLMESRWSSR